MAQDTFNGLDLQETAQINACDWHGIPKPPGLDHVCISWSEGLSTVGQYSNTGIQVNEERNLLAIHGCHMLEL